MVVAVTGAGGLLGLTLVSLWKALGIHVTGWTHQELDVLDAGAVMRAVTLLRPDKVIHAAAWTNVDLAETSPERAMALNRDGTANVARACTQNGAQLVHISSDYVFTGTGTPISIDTPLHPQGAYARSKAEAERQVPLDGLIVRTGWLYGYHRPNFIATMCTAALQGREVRVVNDQIGAPTPVSLVAHTIHLLSQKHVSGMRHCTAQGAVSWYEVARVVYDAAVADSGLVSPCSSAESQRAAPRPRYSVLDCSRTELEVGPMPTWEPLVRQHVKKLTRP